MDSPKGSMGIDHPVILKLWISTKIFQKNMSCQTCETKGTLELQTLHTFTQATL